jgi:hypothetical protein
MSVACARGIATLGTEQLCAPVQEAPKSWREVAVPTSVATLRVPPSYKETGSGWVGPDSNLIRVARRAHPTRDPRDPEGIGIATGPICTVLLGHEPVGLTKWEEFPLTGGVWHGTSATWEEEPGIDIEVVAVARDTKAQLEQIRVLRSVRP